MFLVIRVVVVMVSLQSNRTLRHKYSYIHTSMYTHTKLKKKESMNLKENKKDYMEHPLGREGGIDIIVSSFPNNNRTQNLGH